MKFGDKDMKPPEKYEKVYIYGLIDPRNNQIKYVGWSSNPQRRYKEHLYVSSLETNSHKNNWIKKLLGNNLKPYMIILEEILTVEFEEKEKYWINLFGRKNLTNQTDGGEGCIGYQRKEESNRKSSESQLGIKNHRYGKHETEETKMRKSIDMKGDKNPFFGKTHDAETMNIIANKNQGIKRRYNSSSCFVGVFITRPMVSGMRQFLIVVRP
jgi:group I intron endonuclease